jgi:hypothetical protein
VFFWAHHQLALVYGGREGSRNLPIYLTAGPDLPEAPSSFATPRAEAERYRREADQTATRLSEMKSRSEAIREQILEAQNQLRAARRAKDREAVAALKAKLKELNQAFGNERKAQREIVMQQALKMREQQLQQQQKENPALADLDRKIADLQKQILQASKSRDIEKLKQLKRQFQALNQQRMAAASSQIRRPFQTKGVKSII